MKSWSRFISSLFFGTFWIDEAVPSVWTGFPLTSQAERRDDDRRTFDQRSDSIASTLRRFIHEGNNYLPHGIRAGLMRPKTALSVITPRMDIYSLASQGIRLLTGAVDAFAKDQSVSLSVLMTRMGIVNHAARIFSAQESPHKSCLLR